MRQAPSESRDGDRDQEAAPSPRGLAALRQWLTAYLSARVGAPHSQLDLGERFQRLGLDSLGATAMLTELGALLGRSLSPTLAWQFPTPEELARHLADAQDRPQAPSNSSRQHPTDEPIAIIGMACRLPQAPDPDSFWALLRDGRDAITEVPAARWDIEPLFDPDPAAPGKMSTRWGGFLQEVDGFDAEFFGIAPREAVQVDPQQRLALELAWEALEDAQLPPSSLRDSRTGVFFGAMWMDYLRRLNGQAEAIAPHTATGQDLSIISARVSYTLGLSGPSLTVNTACSSSLVAVHLACQSLLRGESQLCLAGGINLLLAPESTIAMTKFGAMAPDGRCKAFDARANGYVRGEGGGVVVLKPLSAARADGDRIYCVIRGSAVNNDGFSNGLTAPNPRAQEAVLRQACENAGVPPTTLSYVEAHGTGTMLGDPIEAGALGAVLGAGRERPLRIGSVKTNIGHLEAAAGIAGLIKVALAMKHQALPPSLHFERPNPYIAFQQLKLQVQTALEPWEPEQGVLRAGVSSFGFGGTNCHVVVEAVARPEPQLFVLSAVSEQGLRAAAQQQAEALARLPGPPLATLCAAAAEAVAAPFRLAVVVQSRGQLERHLRAYGQGQPSAEVVTGQASGKSPRVGMLFAGQGAQYAGMGRRLYQTQPVFRAAVDRCADRLSAELPQPLLEVMWAEAGTRDAALLQRTAFTQPALFTLEYALAELWRSFGVEPALLLGHSLGELVAACVSGVLSLDDALRLVAARGKLMDSLPSGGAMYAIAAGEAQVAASLAPWSSRAALAAVNGPADVTISGDEAAVTAIAQSFAAQGVRIQKLQVSHAFHSAHMAPIRAAFRSVAETLGYQLPRTPLFSNLDGRPAAASIAEAEYWVRHIEAPVRFADGLQQLAQAQPDVLLEVGPHPVLLGLASGVPALAGVMRVASLERGADDPAVILAALGQLFVAGVPVRLGAARAADTAEQGPEVLLLSARSEHALRAQAAQLQRFLHQHPAVSLPELAFSLATTRSHLDLRHALVCSTSAQLVSALNALSCTPTSASLASRPFSGDPKVVFVFSGQGGQWLGMARQLLAHAAVFRQTVEDCDRLIQRYTGASVLALLQPGHEQGPLEQIELLQPVLFAVAVGLDSLWRSWGVVPAAVVGHSLGEVAAAYCSGSIELADAVRVICSRSRLLGKIRGQGLMALVELELASAQKELQPYAGRLGIAANNGPRSTVISGEPAALTELLAKLSCRGVFCRPVQVDVASHSPQVEPLCPELVQQLQGIRVKESTVPMYSTVTAGPLAGTQLGPEYWADNLRLPVRFAETVHSLVSSGHNLFVELSPHPLLAPAVKELLDSANTEGAMVASLRRGQDDREAMREALAGLWLKGYKVSWDKLYPRPHRRLSLPTYPWQRQRYYLPAPEPASRAGEPARHPLLGVQVPAAGTGALFEVLLGLQRQAWLGDHRVAGRALLAGAGIAELIRAAAAEGLPGPPQILQLVLQAPLALPAVGARRVQLVCAAAGAERSTVHLYSQPAEQPAAAAWTLHASALVEGSTAPVRAVLDLAAVRSRCPVVLDVQQCYARLAAVGLDYGPAFRGLRSLQGAPEEALAAVALSSSEAAAGYGVHPALLDAAFQAVLAAFGSAAAGELLLPFAVDRFLVHKPATRSAWVYARRRPSETVHAILADVTLADETGAVLAEVEGLRLQPAERAALEAVDVPAPADAFYELRWQQAPQLAALSGGPVAGSWVVVAAPGSRAATALGARLADCVIVEPRRLRALLEQRPVPASVVCIWEEADADMPPVAALRLSHEALDVVQVLAERPPARLWWVTGWAVAVHKDDPVAIALSPLWGLGRTLMQEQPELGCTLIDLPPGLESTEWLLAELVAGDDENQLAWRAGRRYAARLVRAAAAAGRPAARAPLPGTVLVTGGLGALGLQVARWLARQGVAHLLLLGRRGLRTPGAGAAAAALQALGARVTVATVDVEQRAELEATLAALPKELPLRGVIHAAGELDDGVLSEQTAARFSRVFQPKVTGAWNLHELTAGHDLEFFVLFSSVTALLGAAGQGNYAAANSFLDALAVYRQARGLKGQSLGWGTWSGAGLAAALDAVKQARLSRQGLKWLSPDEGVALFAQACTRAEAQLAVARLDLRVAGRADGATLPPLWRLLAPGSEQAAEITPGSLGARLAALSPARREIELRSAVQEEVARVLSLRWPSAVAAERPLKELGLDSLLALELRNALARRLGKPLPATLAFDHPTVGALSSWLAGSLLNGEPETVPARPPALRLPDEPIAIVGLGCRYPGGVHDRASFWRLVNEEIDAITEVPRERWDVDALYDPNPEATGKTMSRWGGFLTDLEYFDPGFFGIAPREAEKMDPQQRLLLETSWEALEDAGIRPELLADSDTGVFVGLMYQEYSLQAGGLQALDGYVTTGSAGSVASGRISYLLGLKGPSLTVDTACSSSLVTVHLACQALRQGECAMALAGGVTVMLTPTPFVEFSRLRALSASGRCRSFSAAADGTVWGEGCGMLVLKRLSDARRDRDPILAIIRGSAVNQDGRSNGLTAPSGAAQQALITRALANAAVAPAEVGYVECHGTGTALGDPIEAQALDAALRPGRPPAQPVWIGSVKSNFGHTQAAAGVAGIIKALLALEHGRIPRSLHAESLNPHVPWSQLQLQVATAQVSWPRSATRRIAGVSSFGVSGTNAHVVLEEPPLPEPTPQLRVGEPEVLLLSARSEQALRAQAAQLQRFLHQHPAVSLPELAFSLATTRSHLELRQSFVCSTAAQIVSALAAFASSPTSGSLASRPCSGDPKVVFIFSGQGGQWLGMARLLLAHESVFRQTVATCDRLIQPYTGASVLALLLAGHQQAQLEQIELLQPVLFAVAVGLDSLWRSWGVVPAAVVGHSLGEVAAAYCSGSIELADAVRVICSRSRLLAKIRGQGQMALVELELASAQQELHPYAGRLGIAANNGPRSTVISGEPAALTELLAKLSCRGVFCRALQADAAGHSPQVEPLCPELVQQLQGIQAKQSTVPMYSTVTAGPIAGTHLGPEYWADNLRLPVRFAETVHSLVSSGHNLFVELSPHPLLAPAVKELLDARNTEGAVVSSLRRGQDDREAMREALAGLWLKGYKVPWEKLYQWPLRRLTLPTYPWQRQRYWLDPPAATAQQPRAHGGEHPLLGKLQLLATPTPMHLGESSLSVRRLPWLAEHRVQGTVLFPGAGHVEAALLAGRTAFAGAPFVVQGLVFAEALVLAADSEVSVQTLMTEEQPGRQHLQIASRAPAGGDAFRVHVRAVLQRSDRSAAPAPLELAALRSRLLPVATTELYAALAAMGMQYGPAFQGITALWRGEGEALGRVQLPPAAGSMAGYHFHPALLDACFQVLASMLTAGAEPTPWVLVQVGAVQLLQSPPGELFCHVTALPPDPMLPERAGADLRIVNSLGSTVAEITGLWAQRLAAAAASREAADLFVSLDWEAAPVPAPRLSSGRWLLLGGGDLGRSLQQALSAAGHPAIHLVEAHRLAEALDSTVSVTFGARAPTAVVHLVDQPGPALTEPEAIATALASAYGSVLGTVQTLANRGYRDAPRLWLVTRGAQAVGREPIAVAQAAVLGLARVVAAEHAELRCGCIDLDPAGPSQDAHPLLAELLADDAEEEIVWRGTERRVARLSRWRTSSGEREAAVAIRQDASYLVTGGLGGLGLSVAHWLARKGAGQLVLLGRSGAATAEQAAAVEALAAAGPRVTVVCADVADGARLATLLHELATSGLPLRGVVHAAGLIDDGLLLQQTPARLRTVMAAKVHGALNLHELTRERELDFFVMYSSAAGMLGTAGQGNYAAVNTFLDALAHHRRAQALPALSVAWGPFSGVGGAAAHDLRGARLGARGLASLTAEQGLAALAQLLASRQTQVGVMQLDLRQWAGFNQAAAASRRLSRLWREQSPEAASQKHGLRDRLATADPATRPALLAAGLRRQAAQVLRISEATVDVDMPLMSLGMDSLMGLELRNGIEALLGIKVPSTLLWTYPTVAGLSAHLLAELHLGPPAAPLPPAVAPAGPVEDLSEDELAQLIAAKFEELK